MDLFKRSFWYGYLLILAGVQLLDRVVCRSLDWIIHFFFSRNSQSATDHGKVSLKRRRESAMKFTQLWTQLWIHFFFRKKLSIPRIFLLFTIYYNEYIIYRCLAVLIRSDSLQYNLWTGGSRGYSMLNSADPGLICKRPSRSTKSSSLATFLSGSLNINIIKYGIGELFILNTFLYVIDRLKLVQN